MKRIFAVIMCLVILSSVASAAGGVLKFTATVTTDFDGDIGIRLEGEGGLGVSAWLNPDNEYQQDIQAEPGIYMRMYAVATDKAGDTYKISSPTAVEVYEDGLIEYNVHLLGKESIVGPTDPDQQPIDPEVRPDVPEEEEEEIVPESPGFWKRIATLDNLITLIIILILGGILIYIRVKKTMYKDVD